MTSPIVLHQNTGFLCCLDKRLSRVVWRFLACQHGYTGFSRGAVRIPAADRPAVKQEYRRAVGRTDYTRFSRPLGFDHDRLVPVLFFHGTAEPAILAYMSPSASRREDAGVMVPARDAGAAPYSVPEANEPHVAPKITTSMSFCTITLFGGDDSGRPAAPTHRRDTSYPKGGGIGHLSLR